MDYVKKHFDEGADDYNQKIRRWLPHYDEMQDVIISYIPFQDKEEPNILDLGCGTGNISAILKEKYPQSKITCVDYSEKMIGSEFKKYIFLKDEIIKSDKMQEMIKEFCMEIT